jgi:hypothetical protein
VTLYEFKALPEIEQAEAVWSGIFLDYRDEELYRILLYGLDSFYVEVYYHALNNLISHFCSFTTTRLLEPYLEHINVTGNF